MKTANKEITAVSLVQAALEKSSINFKKLHNIFTFLNDIEALKKKAGRD